MYSDKPGLWWKLFNTIQKASPTHVNTKKMFDDIEDIKEKDKGGPAGHFVRKITFDKTYDQEQADIERERYWQDYTKNTGIEPLYPYISGKEGANAPTQAENIMSGTGIGHIPMSKLYGGMK